MMLLTAPLKVSPRLRHARFGVSGVFFATGFLMATWLVNIPVVQERTSVSHAVLGLLLLVLGLGSLVGMQVVGPLVPRWGSRVMATLGLVLCAITINLPVWTTRPMWLGVALLIFGLANGAAEVAMNDQAVTVERCYGRPIMASFHAWWSIGGAVGALFGAAARALGLDLQLSVGIAAGLALAVGLAAVRLSLPPEHVPVKETDPPTATTTVRPGNQRSKVVLIALLAFLLMLSEGVANDWAPLHAKEHLNQSDAAAAMAYGTFAVAMTTSRLLVDRVAGKFGATFVLRFGSSVAAAGLIVVMMSPVYSLTLVGWAIYGLGLAGLAPQLFTAAGSLPGNASIALSRVIGSGYAGLLAGPAIIGVVAGKTGLNAAFALPVLFCLLGAVLAGRVIGPERALPLRPKSVHHQTPEDSRPVQCDVKT